MKKCFSVMALVLALPNVALAITSQPQIVPEELAARVLAALSSYHHAQMEIVSASSDVISGQKVVCGFYKYLGPTRQVHEFGWVDGKLIFRFGPHWNPATICLIKHYHAPLP